MKKIAKNFKFTKDCGQAKPNGRVPKDPDVPKNMPNLEKEESNEEKK